GGLEQQVRAVCERSHHRVPPVDAPNQDDQREPELIAGVRVTTLVDERRAQRLLVADAVAEPDDGLPHARRRGHVGARYDAYLGHARAELERQETAQVRAVAARAAPGAAAFAVQHVLERKPDEARRGEREPPRRGTGTRVGRALRERV